MVSKTLDEQQIKAVCDVLADTYSGHTKSELVYLLHQSNISTISANGKSNGYANQAWNNKREWLYYCIITEINTRRSFNRVFTFLEKALNPVAFTDEKSRDKYSYMLEGVNKVLLLAGLTMSKEGKLVEVVPAKTLNEVDRRVSSLRQHLYNRAIHSEVLKYCINDYMQNDYYDAVFEAAKGLAERVRQITGLTADGGTLFQTAFSRNDPYLFFNSMQTDSEKSEFIGLRELLESIFHLVRNPVAHTPKVNWKTDETKTLDILTVISFAHKYLDECHRMPGK